MRVLMAAVLVVVFGSLSASGGADTTATQRPMPSTSEGGAASERATNTTNLAMRVFGDLCIAHPTNEGARRSWLQSMGFQMVPSQIATAHLRSGPGTVWMRPDPPSVGFPIAVVTRPSGIQCEVRSPLAEPDLAAQRFKDIVQSLATPGLIIREDADRQTGPGGGHGRHVSFRVGAAPLERGGFHFTMSARPPVPGGLALLVTAAPASPE